MDIKKMVSSYNNHDYIKLLIRQSQTVLLIFYLLIIGIGMVFKYQKYAHFGINIFQYADIFDFLIAPFEDVTIILFTIISTSIPVFFMWLDIRWQKYRPVSYSKVTLGLDRKSWYNRFRMIFFIISFFLYVILSGQHYGNAAKKQIPNQSLVSIRYVDNEIEEGHVIGKTKEVVFLLKNDSVKVIPISSLVKDIGFQKP